MTRLAVDGTSVPSPVDSQLTRCARDAVTSTEGDMSTAARSRTIARQTLGIPKVEAASILLATAALMTIFALQAMRVLVSYLVVVVGQANRGALERDVFVTFGAIILAPLVIWLVGLRVIFVFAAVTAAVARVVLQFWTDPSGRLILAAIIVVLWGWLVVSLLDIDRTALSLGIISGFILDVAIRAGFMTLDLPWNSGFIARAMTVLLAVPLLLGPALVWSSSEIKRSSHSSGIALVGVGPGIALFYLVGGNLGLAQTKTGLDFAPALALLSAGLAAGVLMSTLLVRQPEGMKSRTRVAVQLMIVTAGGAALWLMWTNQSLAPYTLPVVAAVNVILVTSTIQADRRESDRGVSIAPAIWFTIGMLLQAGILFYYYDASGRPRYLAVAAILLALASLAGATLNHQRSVSAYPGWQPFGIVGVPIIVLAIICAWQATVVNAPAVGSTLPGTFTVMTYNLQDGFAADNSFDLEGQVETIAAAHPDVVVLQEVSRGWIVTSGADEALWLSHRLNMPIYFGGNSDDGLWGNAILTRGKVTDVRQEHFTVTKNLKRGMVQAQVETDGGPVWIVGTHLDNPKAADDIRLEQARQIIAKTAQPDPVIIMGDFNADPGTAVLGAFDEAGFTDHADQLLPGTYTTTDDRRLDYILTSDAIRVESMQVIESQASDHSPVVATISLLP